MPVRDAATIIVLRRNRQGARQVLMGQRGSSAVFMPDKFVFPGGAVDPGDFSVWPETRVEAETARRLAIDADPAMVPALCLAGVRELWEETGLTLARPDARAREIAPSVPAVWRGFFEAGLMPRTDALHLVFRAITPPGRPRRFDARFFAIDAEDLSGVDLDATLADGELRHLQWFEMHEARALPLPFITEVVLAEVAALRVAGDGSLRPVPFFCHTTAGSEFRLL